jgi:hypothetical protein
MIPNDLVTVDEILVRIAQNGFLRGQIKKKRSAPQEGFEIPAMCWRNTFAEDRQEVRLASGPLEKWLALEGAACVPEQIMLT